MVKVFFVTDSPRRKQLIKAFFSDKIAFLPNYFSEPINTPSEISKILDIAAKKAITGAAQKKSGIAIAADTVVILKGKALGKPGSKKKAALMLKKISGNKVSVITAIAILDIKTNELITDYEKTQVWIAKLTDEQIDAYVESGEPLDKAGAFAIQGKGAFFVRKIAGDYYNVVGLPIRLLNKMLRTFSAEVF